MNAAWNLFLTFFRIGLMSIGGGYAVIPLIREQVVEKNGSAKKCLPISLPFPK